MNYIISHDIGTSSDKAVLVDFNGNIVATVAEPYPTFYPAPAHVEQDPNDYWKAVCVTSKAVVAKAGIRPEDVKGIVFSTQAQGVIPVDENGNNLMNNITWVDGRAEEQAQKIMNRLGGTKVFTMIVGTPIMGKDCVAKMAWVKDKRPDVYARTKYFLDVNGWLKFKCTGEMYAELSGASSYGLDLKKKSWMSAFPLIGVDMKRLPPLCKSTDKIGKGLTAKAAEETGLVEGTPVFGGCDDVQSAVVGSGMCGDGEVHIYLGTSAWVAAPSRTATKFMHGAAAIQSADPEMNLIAGITEAAGSNIQWICDQFFKHEKAELGEGSTSIWTASSTTSPQVRTISSALRGCWAKDVPSAARRRVRRSSTSIPPTRASILCARCTRALRTICAGSWRITARITASKATTSASSAAARWTRAGCRS